MPPEYRDALCLLQLILRDGRLGAEFGGMGTRRKAIAATISSLVIFGTLVASNVALYESQEQGVVLHAVSDEAKAVATEAELAKGLVALSLRRTSQSALEATGHPCSDTLGAMPALRSIALSSSLGGIAANARGAEIGRAHV